MRSWTVGRIVEFLSAGRWSGSLPESLRDRMAAMATVREYAPEEVIYLQGDAAFGFAAVLRGTVRITRSTATGRETLLHIAQPGFWFGEIAVLLSGSTQVAATARETALVLVVPAAPLQQLLTEEPQHYPAMARLALERYAMVLGQLEQYSRLSPVARVATKLLVLAAVDHAGIGSSPPRLSLKQGELAELVAMSRQTVNGALGRLAREGLIEVGVGVISVLNEKALAHLAETDEEFPRRA